LTLFLQSLEQTLSAPNDECWPPLL